MNCLIYLRVSTKEQAEGGYSFQPKEKLVPGLFAIKVGF